MPKILQISVDGNKGSTGRIAEEIGLKALKRGWLSYIAHGRDTRPSESKTIKIGTDYDVMLHGLKTRLLDRHGLGSINATNILVEQIKDIQPDVIHLHNLHGYYINIEVLFNYLSKANIPVIWTFHDCWNITGHCAHFDFVGCEKWKTECFECPQTKEYPKSYFIDRSRKNYKQKKELFTSVSDLTIVSVSRWLNGIVSESFLGKYPKQVIYNGIDIDVFTPTLSFDTSSQETLFHSEELALSLSKGRNLFSGLKTKSKHNENLNIDNGFMILGVAGIWGVKKGLDEFLELSKKIDKNDFIVLVGLKKSQLRELPENIIGIVHTENLLQLKDLYVSADVFVNLSVEETFGLTTAEALACGTPAIVYNATACPEVIGDTGIVVEKNDLNGVLVAIETIRKNGKEFYSAACRERAVKYFNKNERFAEYIDLYEKVLKTNQSKSIRHAELHPELPTLSNVMVSGVEPLSKGGRRSVSPNYQICTNCIMDTSDPNIIFDENGHCDYCNNYYNNILPNWHPDEQGKKELLKLAEKIKNEGKGKDFDCIIGLSGGPDSSYVAYIAKEIMGLRPLLFHVDAGWNTQQAVSNIEKLVDGMGLDLYTDVINWEEMKDLQVAYFKSQIANMDDPQDIAFFSGMYRFARKFKIKYVMTGANYSTECCREPEEWGAYPGIDKILVKNIHKRFGKIKLKTFPIVDIFTYKIFFKYILGMQIVKPLNCIPYIKKEAEKLLSEKYGWEKFQHKHHESRFTRFYEDYWMPKKFGYEKRRAHFSSLILTGQMTREEALQRISKPEMSEEFLKQEFEYIANKLSLTVAELQTLFEGKNKTYHDYKNKRYLIGLGARAMKVLGLEKRLFR